MNSTNYKIISYVEANKLINNKKNSFVSLIDFNEAGIYKLTTNEFLVRPIFPFFNSLIITDKEFLDNCIKIEQFPIIDSSSASLFCKDELDAFANTKAVLLNQIKNGEKNETNINKVEDLMKSLLKENVFEKYKKNYTILLGEIMIQTNTENLDWAYVKFIGGLNPVIKLVVLDNKNNIYYPIEEAVSTFEKDYKSFKDEASLVTVFKITLDFPKTVKDKYLKKL